MDRKIEQAYNAVTEARDGEPPDSVIWEAAIRDRWVAEYVNGEITISELVDHLDRSSEFLQTVKRVKAERRTATTQEEPENYRRWAINQIFAIEAAGLDCVRAFRSEWLPTGLLDIGEVEAWVTERKSVEGPSSTWITALADDHGNPVPDYRDRVGFAEASRVVRFVTPDREWVRWESVNAVGALIELATVAETLHRRYDWSEARAATYVLTGAAPPAEMARWSTSEPWPWFRARRRMTITVRPDIQPKQLTTIYREQRNRLMRGEPLPRAIGRHKAKLAVFAARNRVGHTWAESMRQWNRENPKHEFVSEPQFTRDSRDAYSRIMGQPLEWVGKLETGEDGDGSR